MTTYIGPGQTYTTISNFPCINILESDGAILNVHMAKENDGKTRITVQNVDRPYRSESHWDYGLGLLTGLLLVFAFELMRK